MLSQKKVKDLEVIKEYYGYSNQKAKEPLNLLSDDQIENIKLGLKKVEKKMSEDTINWSSDMLEVTIKQPDDFLKVRETQLELVSQVVKIKHYFRVVISYINKVNII